MADPQAHVIVCLNCLIEVCRDRELGYRTAADGARNQDLRNLLQSFEQQSAAFAAALQAEVEQRGGVAAETGRVSAWLTRGWLHLTALVNGGDDAAVIVACQRGDNAACEAYHATLAEALPPDVRCLVLLQSESLMAGHERLQALLAVAVGPA